MAGCPDLRDVALKDILTIQYDLELTGRSFWVPCTCARVAGFFWRPERPRKPNLLWASFLARGHRPSGSYHFPPVAGPLKVNQDFGVNAISLGLYPAIGC